MTPVHLYTQVLHWTSGYANYFLPVLGLLILLNLLRTENPCFIHYLGAAVTALFMQLFAEHTTIYTIVLLLFCLTIEKYFSRQFSQTWHYSASLALCAMIFAVIGAGIMFSNSGYHSINSDQYRTVGFGSILETATILAFDVVTGKGVLLTIIGFCFYRILRREKCFWKNRIQFSFLVITDLYALVRTFMVSFNFEQYRRLDLVNEQPNDIYFEL